MKAAKEKKLEFKICKNETMKATGQNLLMRKNYNSETQMKKDEETEVNKREDASN